jgi:Flp pilus assembly protein TadG
MSSKLFKCKEISTVPSGTQGKQTMMNRSQTIERRGTSLRQHERGQGLVEFAVGVIVLLILLMGMLDLGRAFFSYLSVLDAAQEGAAYGSIAPADTNGIRQRVRDTSTGPINFVDLRDSQIDVQVDTYACSGNNISISVQCNFTLVTPFIGGKILPLTAVVTDTILLPPCY